MRWLSLSFVLCLFCFTTVCSAREIPAHNSLVVDEAGIFNFRERDFLAATLTNFQKNYGPQIQLLVVNSLEEEPIENFSIRVVDAWKLGKKGKDDGVLFLVALQDKRMRIEVGRGLEGDLTDALSGRILDHEVKPFFRDGQYREGIMNGLNMIAVALGGKLDGVRLSRVHHRGITVSPFIIFLIFFLIVVVSGILNFFGLGRHGRGYWGPSYGGGGWGGGGWGSGGGWSSGGGFSGGGGGGFSGGGASGNW